ncbi:GNAT family N-acetyltransferase [Cognatishimia sp. WU-CL00825]|uniref:GNAT family N-acetyltransferase n=1 Tax=Cognatishimia sp. WU-CL00825 TaxID=3127658 RepID=UPI003103F990
MSWDIASTDDITAVHELRREIFIKEQGFNEEDEWDDLDDQAIQILAKLAQHPVGTARILINGNIGRIGRICVVKSQRGTGLGAALVQFGIDHLRQTPSIARVKLGAQEQAIGFYEKLGFQVCGQVYDDGGVPHREMEIVL